MTGRRLAKLTCALSAALASCGWIIDADFDRAYPGPFAAEAPGLGSVTVSDVAVVSRHPGELDLFALAGGELRYYHYDARGGGWSAGVHLATFGYAPRTLCATRNGPRVDVFTGGTGDGAILHHFSTEDVTAWHGPYKLVNTGRVHPASRVAATSFAPGRLDLFWFLESGNLGHAWSWAGDYFWAGTETGDSAELVHLQPLTAADASGSLEAVSLGPGQIDLFFLDASTPRLEVDARSELAVTPGTGALAFDLARRRRRRAHRDRCLSAVERRSDDGPRPGTPRRRSVGRSRFGARLADRPSESALRRDPLELTVVRSVRGRT
jgi:hypothetical protein